MAKSDASSSTNAREWFPAIGVSILLLLLVASLVHGRYGSFTNVLEFLRGESISAHTVSNSSGQSIVVKNLTGNEIALIGVRPSCTCVVTEGVPCTLGPYEQAALLLDTSDGEANSAGGYVVLFTDLRAQPELVVTIPAFSEVPEDK